MNEHKKDCLKCLAKESVLIRIGKPTSEGVLITIERCSFCDAQFELEDFLPHIKNTSILTS